VVRSFILKLKVILFSLNILSANINDCKQGQLSLPSTAHCNTRRKNSNVGINCKSSSWILKREKKDGFEACSFNWFVNNWPQSNSSSSSV
jgi:hypothetical protein